MPTAHQEQFRVQYLAQGHFDMQLGGVWILTSDLKIQHVAEGFRECTTCRENSIHMSNKMIDKLR